MSVRRTLGVLASTALLAGLTACGGTYGYNDKTAEAAAGPPTAAAPSTIVMKTYAFSPKAIDSAPGQVWAIDNQDAAVHDVRTKDNKTIFSGDVGPRQKGSVKMPMKAGKYSALCYYHPSMVIDITVK